jgi:hypothetical protein
MDEDARKLRIRDTFWEAVGKAKSSRKDINVTLDTEERDGALLTQVTILSQHGEFRLNFVVGTKDEVMASGPKGRHMGCSLDVDSIASVIMNEVQREFGPKS